MNELLLKKVTDHVKEAVFNLNNSYDKTATYIYNLKQDDKIRWALVIAWTGDFDNVERKPFQDEDYRICGKIAYQKTNSIMAEYDIDWLMPFDAKTDDVWDTETTISSYEEIEKDVKWWLDQFNEIQSSIEKGETIWK